ncbi:MAG: hypothetical protein AMXMBFR33_16560 [Candidatus Xenobia bacterium]|jgi:hypothetical protein
MKVPSQTRDRIRALAEHSGKSMAAVIEEALTCFERSLRAVEYLEGWNRFKQNDPEGFAEYARESELLESGLSDAVPE